MKRTCVKTGIVAVVTFAIAACGGGGSSSSGDVLSALTTGYTLPSDISAVPVDNSSPGVQSASLQLQTQSAPPSISGQVRALATTLNLAATSDYAEAVPRKYIEERALEQFDIIEQVLKAVAQTHYADEVNINAGAYKAMVAWEDEQNGVEIKTLQPWVIESMMVVLDGRDVNRVRAWIEEPDEEHPGESRLIKAEFKIYTPATIDADGEITDYGEWTLNVKFDDAGDDFFVATAGVENGMSVIQIHERMPEGPGFVQEMQGILYRSGTSGYGKVSYPDWSSCMSENCTPDTATVQYAYNADYLALDDGSGVTYKDRNGTTEMTHRYGLFFAHADAGNGIAAGDNLTRHRSFGFPVSYTDSNGGRRFAYYGAWQGRHQIWAGDGTLPAGTTVTREDRGPSAAAQTYTVSDALTGTFTKRTLVDGALSDIQDIPVETWINKHYDMNYDGATTSWKYCDGMLDWSTNPATCRDANGNAKALDTFTDFASLVVASAVDRKNVNIGRWDNIGMQMHNYVYLASNPGLAGYSGAGFYEAQMNNMGPGPMTPVAPAQKYTPADGEQMFVDIGGALYIQYTGSFAGPVTTTGWVQKTLSDFDQQTWTPSFAANGDSEFNPDVGREYYINSRGANYVVKRVDGADVAGSYDVKIELQTAANPENYASLLPAGTAYLAAPWRREVQYSFDTDPNSSTFLKLVYANDDPATTEDETGDVYENGAWGLQPFSAGDQPLMADGTAVIVDAYGIPTNANQRPVEFNWEYSADGGWGTQQFLMDGNDYVLLDDPVQLQPVTLVNNAGDSKTLALQFDGWMHGLPDMYEELSKNDWTMTSTISDKIISIPAGTEVTGTDATLYYVKPLEVSVFLNEVTAGDIGAAGGTAPDLTEAAAVNLDSVPDFTEHNLGDLPTGVETLYSEGIEVE
ncbi:MAG: hypothetical protein HY941_06200 [Gammaproteobacteria bacterium]|nr:hypothetical protein [Gammaproteobacteria bacterium]